jgi:lambda repressor-like predicted transcriptional regulator
MKPDEDDTIRATILAKMHTQGRVTADQSGKTAISSIPILRDRERGLTDLVGYPDGRC